MSYVDALRDQIEEQLKSGKDGLDWIDKNAPAIIRTALNVYLATIVHLPIPGFVVDRFADEAITKLHEGTAEIRKALDEAEKAIAFVGSPDRLREAATVIGDAIVTPARDLASGIVLGKLPSTSTSNWDDGEASEGYVRAIDGRDAAVTGIDTYASPISSALDELADAIESYYLSLLLAVLGVVSVVLSLVEAILALVGVVTAPAAIVGLIGVVVGGITAGVNIYQVIVTAEQNARSITGALSGKIPEWPRVLA